MVGGRVNPVIGVIIDNHNNDNSNDAFTPNSVHKIFLGKYNSLYADDLDREKVSTPVTGRIVENVSLYWNLI